ncbi:MAG: sugar phosphate isomerase/epimerase [Planctomycetes bacterium]|nr:sugar phosphate isomerase/epimerase [Planctomycetota bacterium]
MRTTRPISRRDACRRIAAAGAACVGLPRAAEASAARPEVFRLRTILASCMYGKMRLEEVLPEVARTGAAHIDIWPAVHGDQREQVEAMGHAEFAALLAKHAARLGIITRYDLGPLRLREELLVASELGASLVVTGSRGPAGLKGSELKAEIVKFVEAMKPHIEVAEAQRVAIAIENHASALIHEPDSIRWLAELSPSKRLGIALAPYHLEQDSALIGRLVRDAAPRLLHFYAWQHGKGCHQKLPKEDELLQMPGRGPLDFGPILAALGDIEYRGWTEIFMHPVPRGIPILPTAREVTEAINRARRYLESCLRAPAPVTPPEGSR